MTRYRPIFITGFVLFATALPALGGLLWSEHYYFKAERTNERQVDASFELAVGQVFLKKGKPGIVFEADVLIEGETDLRPHFDYDGGQYGDLDVSLENKDKDTEDGIHLSGVHDLRKSEWNLFLGTEAPFDLDIELALAEGDFDLTGIPVEALHIECGLASTRVRFDAPNPVVMDDLRIDAGAGKFVGERLGFSRAERIEFDGGAGEFYLDFSGGELPRGGKAIIDVGMASLMIVVPDDQQVVIKAPDSWFTKVRVPDGYIKHRDGEWRSAARINMSSAYKITVDANMGKVNFVLPREAESPWSE